MSSMKRNIYKIWILALTFIACCACVKESSPVDSKDGEPVLLSLNVFSGHLDKVIVKGWDPNDANEVAVYDLRVYVFSEAGELVGYKFYANSDLSFKNDSDSEKGYDKSAEVKGIETVTGNVYIYGIANAVTSQYSVQDERILNPSGKGLKRAEFLSAVYSRQKESINPMDNVFLMSGSVNNGGPVHVSRKAGSTEGYIDTPASDDEKRLKLYKVVSKNKITLETKDGISFDPDYYVIYNVPAKAPLIGGVSTASYSDFEVLPRTVMNEMSVNFYLPENIQNTDKDITSWNDREKNLYDSEGKSFVNAPDDATYIVIYGKYKDDQYTGNVYYTIHLGDFGNSGAHDYTNFKVVRNYKYDYTIKINGVDKIIAEATSDEDSIVNNDNPGAEGVIIKSENGEVFEVDCHYEARVFSFTKREILGDGTAKNPGLKDFGYIVKFKTAFGETESLLVRPDGIYDPSAYEAANSDDDRQAALVATLNGEGKVVPVSGKESYFRDARGNKAEHDYYWVHFIKNTGKTSGDGSVVDSSHSISDVCRYPGDRASSLKNVFQMLSELLSAKDNYFDATVNGEAGVYYTCFIDENYYSDREWTKYVNQTEDRMVYFANKFSTSPDKMSSYAEAKYVISQQPIWTFYKLDASLVPYGVESVSEEEKIDNFALSYGSYTGTDETWDGLKTTKSNILNKPFYSGLKQRKDEGQDLYTDVFKACMSRNRDKDGDGVIDSGEIEWYLAAVNQYIGLWNGEEILPTEARLFEPTLENWEKLKIAYGDGGDTGNKAIKYWHYFTSSDMAVFWAEEGTSTSSKGHINSWGAASKVRCVRNLESNGQGIDRTADKYYSTSSVSDGTEVTIRLDEDALRGYQESAMSPSLERGENTTNKLYSKFIIAKDDLSGTYTRDQIINARYDGDFISSTADVCKNASSYGGAWRVPNQRELSIISMVLTTKPTNFMWSNTFFTGSTKGYYKQNVGQGLNWQSSGQLSIDTSGAGYVRCVRDVQD